MSKPLTRQFIERKLYQLLSERPEWRLDLKETLYELDLKMCQLKSLNYDFQWGKESLTGPQARVTSITDTPSRIVKLDLSLNELTALEHAGLSPFFNVRDLNASLNKITSFAGIELLKHLYTLNLSHNAIRQIQNLVGLPSLVELNISMNELTDISLMPSLVNVQILNINNNHLTSLDGIQALPRLTELYAQRNEIKDIIPLTSCFHLQILNVSSNHIQVFHSVISVLSQLKRLEVLNLHGNPVDRDPMYQTEILKFTDVITLDNIAVRPLPKQPVPSFDSGNAKHTKNIESLKEAAKQAFEERMKESKQNMEENVNFLQRRIVLLQHEYMEYENKLKNDLEACLRYLDSLTLAEMGEIDRSKLRQRIRTPTDKPWDHGRRSRKQEEKEDYSQIKDTDLLLRYAKKELQKDN